MALLGGLIGAWALRGVIVSQLYGVGPLDPIVMLMVLAMVATLACIGPARRAALVSPMVALTRN